MVKFYRMNGIGNKFIIYDLRNSDMTLEEVNILSQNQNPDSFDQKIILLDSKKSDVLMKVYNSDNSVGTACGNASRCVARIVSEDGLDKEIITIETCNRVLEVRRITATRYDVNMGKPLLSWDSIALTRECDPQNLELLNHKKFGNGFALNVGNPHIVFFVQDIKDILLTQEVSFLGKDTLFKDGVNINIAQIISTNEIQLKTWERGAGETLACGTGACATAYSAYYQGLIGSDSKVYMPGGDLDIKILDDNIFMSGETALEEVCFG